jgi:hypothetical protein
MDNYKSFLFVSVLALVLLIAGCASPTPPAAAPNASGQNPTPSPPVTAPNASAPIPPATGACADKSCFISAANDCQELSFTSSEDIGVFQYSSAKNCTFTKTLVSLNAGDTAEMKALLEGKSFACRYKKGQFDERLVNTLLFGSEKCNGELKEILAELVAFT